MLVKLASLRSFPVTEAMGMAQETGTKYITVASRFLRNQ